MTAVLSIRAAAKTRLVDLLAQRNQLAGVEVRTNPPGRVDREHVWIGDVTGEVSWPVMMAGRKQRDDRFTLPVWFATDMPGASESDADARATEMYSALDDLMAEDQTLDDLDGVVSALLVASVEGPNAQLTDEGARAFVRAAVEVHSRLH